MLVDKENFIDDLQRFAVLQFQLKLPDPKQVFIDGGISALLFKRFPLFLFPFDQLACALFGLQFKISTCTVDALQEGFRLSGPVGVFSLGQILVDGAGMCGC